MGRIYDRKHTIDAEIRKFSEVLRPGHPKLKLLTNEQKQLESELAILSGQIISLLQIRSKTLHQGVTELEKAIQQIDQQALEFSKTLARYQHHVSKLDRLEERYKHVLTTYSPN